MSKIVTIFNEKGGAGKTTTACQLAGTLGLRGYDVMVADLDPQQSSTNWISAAPEGTRFPASLWRADKYNSNITAELQIQSSKYDIIIADCAPSIGNPTTWGTLLVSDLAIIPSKLNPPDISALVAAKKMARRVHQETGRPFPIRVLPNAARLHFKDDKAALALLMADKEFPPMRSILGDRKAFTRAMQFGVTAHSLPHGEDAVAEIEKLADEVLKYLGMPAKPAKGK